MRNPFDAGFDVVTTTTHKSLRGPRGGLVLCRKKLAPAIDKSVFPGLQGGPHLHTIAGIAVTLKKAQGPAFRTCAVQVLRNAKTLAAELMARGGALVTGGTDNHMMVLDTASSFGLDGRAAEQVLDAVSITTNKQIIPDDPNPPLRPSGIRLGTPAATTRGMGEEEMRLLAGWMVGALRSPREHALLEQIRARVEQKCARFAVPGLEPPRAARTA